MTAPNPMSLNEVIAALRAVKAETRPTPSVAQLRRLIDDVVDCVPMAQIVGRAEMAKFATADVLTFAEEFGKHRARVRKRSAQKGFPVAAADTGTLFGIPTPELQNALEAHRSGKRLRKAQKDLIGQLPQEVLEAEGPAVVLPTGFEKSAGHGRDISRSLAALAVDAVDDAEIIRFAERHFSKPTTLLDADHVHLLHWVASNQMAEKLLEIGGLAVEYVDGNRTVVSRGGSNSALVGLLVEAYDLLEVARGDAMSALETLTQGAADVGELRDAARKARWVSPGEIGRLEKMLAEVDRNPGVQRLSEMLASKLRNFTLWVRANPSTFAVTSVEALTSAHLTQILAASGLLVDEAEEKAITAELRSRLTEMGLTNDLDREIPEGLRAFRLGRLEEFYTSRQARVDGDPDWKLLYEANEATAELATV